VAREQTASAVDLDVFVEALDLGSPRSRHQTSPRVDDATDEKPSSPTRSNGSSPNLTNKERVAQKEREAQQQVRTPVPCVCGVEFSCVACSDACVLML
jgi:hypothetical protein